MLDKFNEQVGTKLNIRNLDGLGINSIEVKSNFRLKNLTEEEFNEMMGFTNEELKKLI